MTAIEFLAEWAVRSAVLILCGALLLWVMRVKAASIRLAAWTAMLAGSLAIPVVMGALPKMVVPLMRAPTPVVVPAWVDLPDSAVPVEEHRRPEKVDWVRATLILWGLGAAVLLVRLGTGLAIGLQLRRASRATGQATDGIEIRETDLLESPVTLGIVRASILLPSDWPRWDAQKMEAVLTHERSHIRRYDPAVQFLSAIHRAVLWFSPMSWVLHQRLVRTAEEASDDAAVERTGDRALYAKVLLEFMQRGVRGANWLGVPMARYGRPDQRIHRILDGKILSGRLTRWSVAAILGLGLPLAYLVAAVGSVESAQPAPAPVLQSVGDDAMAVPVAVPEAEPNYLMGLGSVTATTVTVKPRVDGELTSVNFKDGDVVQAGQLLATIDPHPYQLQLDQAEGELEREKAQFLGVTNNRKRVHLPEDQLAQADGTLKAAQAKVDEAKLQLAYTQLTAPIAGVTGLRMVDPGNIVRASDSTGIVVINQLRPIAVLFSIAEDRLPEVLRGMRDGGNMAVEAWSRERKVRYATGRLAAIDNQIDTATGTVKLKAVFENKDGALFPNQFVNVRLILNVGGR